MLATGEYQVDGDRLKTFRPSLQNVIVVCDSAVVDGGAAKVALQTANALSDQRIAVAYFSAGERFDSGYLDGADVHLAQKQSLRASGKNLLRALSGVWDGSVRDELAAFIRKFNPLNTVVHVHSWASVLSPSIFDAVSEREFPLVITAHDYGLICPNSCCYSFPDKETCSLRPGSRRCLFRDCDRDSYPVKLFRDLRFAAQTNALRHSNPTVVCVSEFQKRVLERHLPFECDLRVVENPIIAGQEDCGASESKEVPRFLFVGRLEAEKGIDLFCQAIDLTGFEGVVVGDGGMRGNLEVKYPRIQFCGWLDEGCVAEQMRRACALVFPSRWYEAAPLTPLEAQLHAALPCIVSDGCAASEEIVPGETGLLFREGDLEDLVDKMVAMTRGSVDSDMKKQIGNQLQMMRQRYSVDGYCASILSVYERALRTKSKPEEAASGRL